MVKVTGTLAALALVLTGCHGGTDNYVLAEGVNRRVVVYHHDAEPLPATLSKACDDRPYALLSGGPAARYSRDVEEYLIECR
jgi:hypothetical protein